MKITPPSEFANAAISDASESQFFTSSLNCRTAYLGGHVEECDHCGIQRDAYNSCRNRHCPKCQTITKERWLEARKAELLPVPYFHSVFTLPHKLNPVILCNKKVMLRILFKAVSEMLLEFGANPENGLGGKLGFISLLHTWDQLLNDHFHLHCLVPGGALADGRNQWIWCENDFLFPIQALSPVFRGKYIYRLSHIKLHCVIGRRRITIQPSSSIFVQLNM